MRNLGIVAATTPLVLWAQGLGWHTTFLFVGFFHLAVTLTFVLAFRDGRGTGESAPSPAPLKGGIAWRASLVLRDRQVWLMSWAAFIR